MEKKYWLLFVKEKDSKEWGFYGFYWHEDELQERRRAVVDTFEEHRIIEGKFNP